MRHLLSRIRRFVRFESTTIRRFVTGYPAVRRTPVLQASIPVEVEELSAPPEITNPSIAELDGERVIAARTVTYRLSRLRRSMVPIPGRHRTVTYLIRHGRPGEGVLPAVDEVDFSAVGADREFEDARLFAWRGSLWGLWTESRMLPDGHYLNSMVLGRLDGARVVDLMPLPSPHGREREKNWMPLVDGDRLLLVYDLSSLEVYEVTETGLRLAHIEEARRPELHRLSGSSQFVRHDGGWLGVAHRSTIRPLMLPWLAFAYYRHVLVHLNDDFSLRAVSAPFFFTRRAIEFCGGLVVDGGSAVLSFGVDDERAALVRVRTSDLRALMGSAA